MNRRFFAAVAVAALVSAGCGTLFDQAAASVGDEKITTDEVEGALARFEQCDQFDQAAQEGSPNEVRREYQQTYLSRLIRREVLEKESAEAGVEVTDADVDQLIDQIREDFESEKAFQDELKAQCVTLAEVRGFVRDSELEQRLRERVTEDIGPSEEELQAEYDSRVDDFTEIDVSHILVSDRAEANRIYDRLQDTSENDIDQTFARLAEEFSTDAGSAGQGGSLGYLSPSDVVPEFADAALALEEGEISEPVQSQFGWHIIRLIDTRVRPYEEARQEIADELAGQEEEDAWQEFLEAAYQEADVEVNPRFGRLDPETQLVTNDDADSVPAGQPEPEPTASPPPDGAPEDGAPETSD
jgi:parvulin-like peptidyl-prolyl isomerase